MKLLLGLRGDRDPSEPLDRVLERATAAGDSVTIVVYGGDGDVVALAEEHLAAAGVDGTVRELPDDAGSRLVAIAEAEGFDRIVLDGGAQSPMGKIEVGSVAEYVLLNSHVTVTLLR